MASISIVGLGFLRAFRFRFRIWGFGVLNGLRVSRIGRSIEILVAVAVAVVVFVGCCCVGGG